MCYENESTGIEECMSANPSNAQQNSFNDSGPTQNGALDVEFSLVQSPCREECLLADEALDALLVNVPSITFNNRSHSVNSISHHHQLKEG